MFGIADSEKEVRLQKLEEDVIFLKTENLQCQIQHRRHDDVVKIMMEKMDKICANTEASARGDAAKQIVKESLYAAAKMLGALGVITASVWHIIDYLIKFAQVSGNA